MAGCPEGGATVFWSNIQQLAAEIDAAAEGLNIPDWSKLTEQCLVPFYLPSTVPFQGYLQVYLESKSDHFLVTGNQLVHSFDNPWSSGDPKTDECLTAVAGDPEQELFLVDTQEVCWCTTHVKVQGVIGALASAVDQGAQDRGCCPKLCVPLSGMKLMRKKDERDDNPDGYACWQEDFVPVSKLVAIEKALVNYETSDSDPDVRYFNVRPCKDAPSGDCVVRMRKIKNRWKIDAVLRKMEGYFTWRIAKKQFAALIGGMESLVANSCGSDGSISYAGYSCGDLPKEFCDISLIDVMYTMQKCDEEVLFTCPGAIEVTESAGSSAACGSAEAQYPWDGLTNGATNACDVELAVYKALVDQMHAIIERIKTLKPYQEDGCDCPPCSVCWEAGAGYKGSCAKLEGSSDTPVVDTVTIGVTVGCYDYAALGGGHCASPDTFGFNLRPANPGERKKNCSTAITLGCKETEECKNSKCKGCNPDGGSPPAHPEDFYGWKIYPNYCQEPGPTLLPGLTWNWDFRGDCCRGMLDCACGQNDSEFPA